MSATWPSSEQAGNTDCQPLGVVGRAGAEESTKRVIARNDKPSEVGKQLSAEVEDDEEEVECAKADGSVGLGNTHRLLDVVNAGYLDSYVITVNTFKPGRMLVAAVDSPRRRAVPDSAGPCLEL